MGSETTGRSVGSRQKPALVKAALIDAVCLAGGAGLFLVTGNWIWLVAGLLLGAGFLLPAVIAILRTKR